MSIEVYKLNSKELEDFDRQFIKTKVKIDDLPTCDDRKIVDAYIETSTITCKYDPDNLEYDNNGIFTSSSGISFMIEDDVAFGTFRKVATFNEHCHYVKNLNASYYRFDKRFRFRANNSNDYYYLKNGTKISCKLLIIEIVRKLKDNEELNNLERRFILSGGKAFKELLEFTDFEDHYSEYVYQAKDLLLESYNLVIDVEHYLTQKLNRVDDITHFIF